MTNDARRAWTWVLKGVAAVASVTVLAAAPRAELPAQAQPPHPAPQQAPSRASSALPTATEIIARHVAAIGGEAAYQTVTSMRAYGRFDIAAQGISGALELLSARPNKLLYRVTIAGIGRIESGYDGSIGWTISPIAGPELLSGKQLADAADDACASSPPAAARRSTATTPTRSACSSRRDAARRSTSTSRRACRSDPKACMRRPRAKWRR
jgi:hypothetical protein